MVQFSYYCYLFTTVYAIFVHVDVSYVEIDDVKHPIVNVTQQFFLFMYVYVIVNYNIVVVFSFVNVLVHLTFTSITAIYVIVVHITVVDVS